MNRQEYERFGKLVQATPTSRWTGNERDTATAPRRAAGRPGRRRPGDRASSCSRAQPTRECGRPRCDRRRARCWPRASASRGIALDAEPHRATRAGDALRGRSPAHAPGRERRCRGERRRWAKQRRGGRAALRRAGAPRPTWRAGRGRRHRVRAAQQARAAPGRPHAKRTSCATCRRASASTGFVCEFNITGQLWTSRVTSHVPLRDVADADHARGASPTPCTSSTAPARAPASRSPRIAVAALNPHAGDGGSIGREEIDVIAPAVDAARATASTSQRPLAARHRVHRGAARRLRRASCRCTTTRARSR